MKIKCLNSRIIQTVIFRLYCRYAYDNSAQNSSMDFKSREAQLKHFLNRLAENKLNKWPPPRFYSESYHCELTINVSTYLNDFSGVPRIFSRARYENMLFISKV